MDGSLPGSSVHGIFQARILQKDSSVGEGKLNKAGEESLMPAGKYIGVNCSCPQSGDSVSRLPGLVSVFNSCRDTLGHRLGD